MGRLAVDEVLSQCAPAWLSRGGEIPNESYVPTFLGLLASSERGPVLEFAERMLSYLRGSLMSDPTFSRFSSERLALELGISPAPEVPFMAAVLSAFRLIGSGSAQGSPYSSFEYELPFDIEDVIACADVAALVRLRLQASG